MDEGDRQFDGSDHAIGASDALSSDVEGGAVVRGGSDEGKANGGVNGAIKGQQFDRDQPLVMIEGEVAIVGGGGGGVVPGLAGTNPEGVWRHGAAKGEVGIAIATLFQPRG